MYPTPAGEAFQENGVWYQDYNVQDPVTGQVVVKRYMHNGSDWVEAPNQAGDSYASFSSKVDLTKKIPNTASGINLKKTVVNLDKCLVSLTKKSGINLGNHVAKVAVVLDFSGSMRSLYRNGAVQRTLNRLVPLGLRFDDNGEVDVWLFHDGFRRLESMDLSNYETYVNEVIFGSGERFGCTSYAPVIEDVMRKYIREDPSSIPSFVIFITDGANDDKRDTDNIIRRSSEHNIFIQFIGLDGSRTEPFTYLRKLDDLSGRACDNTGFFDISSFDNVSDDELYNKLLEQYVDWLKVKRLS